MKGYIDHLFIPDTQVKPGIRLDYMRWAGQYIVDHFLEQQKPVRVIHAGDNWDMPSLSSYDRGTGKMEGRRYSKDIDAGNDGFATLNEPITDYIKANKVTLKKVMEDGLDLHFLFGNHEDRITRAANADVQLDGLVTLDDCDTRGWQRHEYLKPIVLDGVVYSHYFYNPLTGRPLGGLVSTQLKTLGHTFTQGHKQTFDYAVRYVNGRSQHALIAGAYYVHDEDYKGPQGNAHWRGLVVCHGVEHGSYNLMQVGIEYLCRRYEGVTLSRYKVRHYS